MSEFEKKEVLHAVLIADNNIENFRPLSNDISTGLLPLANVPLLDYALESLNRSGVEKVFVYASLFINEIREHIKKRVESRCSWSIKMSVQVIGAEGCRCLGDALRDLDSKGLIRSHFILLGADTVTNANLSKVLEDHKKNVKFDKGAALTVVFKEATGNCRTGDEVFLALDVQNNRLHFHQRIRQNTKESNFNIPLEVFLNNSKISLHHNLLDPQIAICSPSVLSLFSDNFDFENRDDFIRGLLINEEILDSRIYVSLLPTEYYARKVSNWLTYQMVSNDVINRWAYPLVPDMGICNLWQNYSFLRNNIYKSPKANVSRVLLRDNIVVEENSNVEAGCDLSLTVIGKNCKVGKNCTLKNAFLFDNVVIANDCDLQYCVIGSGSHIGACTKLSSGAVVGTNVVLPPNSNLSKVLIQSTASEYGVLQTLGDNAYVVDDEQEIYISDSEDEDFEPTKVGIPKMISVPLNYEESDYNSTSEEDESRAGSPIPDDTNIFLSEVIDSLSRGFQEKSNPDFLILEINSSRYAYNMTLKEVNFYVVKAMFSLPSMQDTDSNILTVIHKVFSHLGHVVTNYIKSDESMTDCLKAVEECCNQNPDLQAKAAQIIHYLYDKEYVNEDAILSWYSDLTEESDWLRKGLKKLVDWLMASSEEESDE